MTSYREAGVDLDGAGRHVEAIAPMVTASWTENVIGGFGGFAAGVTIPAGYSNPVLMMTTDGVGTKLEVARRAGRWDGVGHDLVAMCVDDLAAVGARPLGFVDYLAVGSLVPERDRSIVESISRACREARCPLLGGETAEHPGVMAADAVDLAGAAMGVVEKGEQLPTPHVAAGDVVVGLSSLNLRSNGFSLVRSILQDEIVDLAPELLQPSVIYSPTVLAAISGGGVVAAAHITGGGIAANLGRSLPEHLGAVIDTTAWTPPSVFGVLQNRGVPAEDMYRTFNMGIGFALVIKPDSKSAVMSAVGEHHPSVIGEVTEAPGVRLA